MKYFSFFKAILQSVGWLLLKSNVECLLYFMSFHGNRMFLLENELTGWTSVINCSQRKENVNNQSETGCMDYSQ